MDRKSFLSVTGSGVASALILTSPVLAQTVEPPPTQVEAAVTDIQDTFGALGTISVAALAVVLGVVGIYFGIGYGKKIMSRG